MIEEVKAIFVTPAVAAKMLGMSRSKIYELLRAGVIPSRKFGAAIRIPVRSLERMAIAADKVQDEGARG
ncbi:MAG TPA: helix-turn-helix domain-containing protein [Candidatus Binataceae bacterium]|nr:helix-turn-helix domain-containing protein [Candidatus Binataceae bacterium]